MKDPCQNQDPEKLYPKQKVKAKILAPRQCQRYISDLTLAQARRKGGPVSSCHINQGIFKRGRSFTLEIEFIKLDKLGKEKRKGESSWVPGGRACRVSPALCGGGAHQPSSRSLIGMCLLVGNS